MRIVIDASMTMAWCFGDEATQWTETVLDRVLEEGGIAPSIWPTEVANSILVGRRRGRLTPLELAEFLVTVRGLPVLIDPDTPSRAWNQVFDLATLHRLSAYDACYLDLAIRERLPLATLDGPLRDAARSIGLEVLNPI